MTLPKLGSAISTDAMAQLAAIEAATRLTRRAVLENAIAMLHESMFTAPDGANLVLGYLRLDRFGELEPTDACPVCGSAYEDRGIWLRVHGSGVLTGPLCSRCASSA